MKSVAGTVWCNTWIFGGAFCYGFCPSAKAWHATMKRLGYVASYPTTAGHATIFTKDNQRTVVVTVAESHDKGDGVVVSSLILHEAVHVWQEWYSLIGESDPSAEFEAYMIQHIYIELMDAYTATRGEIFKRAA